MNNDCGKWKDALLEAALADDGNVAPVLAAHLRECGDCTRQLAALRQRREQMDALLPQLARDAEPGAGFTARVVSAARAAEERKHTRAWRVWVFAGATVAVVAALLTGWSALRFTPSPAVPDSSALASAQKLAEWHAPSDVLLATPGRRILQGTPKLGVSYLKTEPHKR
jgi:anti-sigma-K factor RskA